MVWRVRISMAASVAIQEQSDDLPFVAHTGTDIAHLATGRDQLSLSLQQADVSLNAA